MFQKFKVTLSIPKHTIYRAKVSFKNLKNEFKFCHKFNFDIVEWPLEVRIEMYNFFTDPNRLPSVLYSRKNTEKDPTSQGAYTVIRHTGRMKSGDFSFSPDLNEAIEIELKNDSNIDMDLSSYFGISLVFTLIGKNTDGLDIWHDYSLGMTLANQEFESII